MSDMIEQKSVIRMDAWMPAEMAVRAENLGVRKAEMPFEKVLLLAVLAGAFIGLGAEFFTIVITGTERVVGFGLTKLLGGLAFSLGLILVVVAGAELYTGNNLIVMAYASGKIPARSLLRNWAVVYAGNFLGSILTALSLYFSGQYAFAGGAVGKTAVAIANAKCGLDFWPALLLGVYCNVLVCLAIWLCFSAQTTTDRILAIVFPITAFVASGFEHCVANMYFIPLGLFIKSHAAFSGQLESLPNLTWGHFIWRNLLPVTIGNTIGGAGFVGVVYWWIHLRPAVRLPVEETTLKATERGLPIGAQTVLVVDDDPDFTFVVSATLEQEGYDVWSAFSAEEGLEAINNKRPDLVLLDVRMETESAGLDLVRRLRAQRSTRDIPIILVSGADVPEDHGANGLLTKPITYSLLGKTVSEIIDANTQHQPKNTVAAR